MKRANLAAVILTLLCLGGCVTSGSYCDVARPILPSMEDSMTQETKRQIVSENTKLEKLCGVKP
ncbi:hypothetical protein C7374_11483 [Falsochrobactrum ovis]|uniref:Uncharacterized protein n=1 Tax=Falsochrobactrum ovis TaxID=1293442 RepID=A0A364JSW7_9HYPH|nr:hypothetical protein C7374_11483 [Falsochrobactrum ovis]